MLTILLEIRGNIGCHAEVLISSGGREAAHVPDPQLVGVWMLCTSKMGCYSFAQALLCINKFAVFD